MLKSKKRELRHILREIESLTTALSYYYGERSRLLREVSELSQRDDGQLSVVVKIVQLPHGSPQEAPLKSRKPQ